MSDEKIVYQAHPLLSKLPDCPSCHRDIQLAYINAAGHCVFWHKSRRAGESQTCRLFKEELVAKLKENAAQVPL